MPVEQGSWQLAKGTKIPKSEGYMVSTEITVPEETPQVETTQPGVEDLAAVAALMREVGKSSRGKADPHSMTDSVKSY